MNITISNVSLPQGNVVQIVFNFRNTKSEDDSWRKTKFWWDLSKSCFILLFLQRWALFSQEKTHTFVMDSEISSAQKSQLRKGVFVYNVT